MKKPNFVNVENAFHVAGFAATAFSAKAALTYLATTFSEGDNITATGFAGIIGLMVASTWTFAFLAKSRQERIKLMALGVLATAISGYTVYQSSIIPLERDAIAKAAEQDRPILAKFNADNNVYRASLDNLQKSIDDLRKQKTSIEADKAAIAKTDKQRDWKQSQLQNKLDALQDSIDRKTNDLKQLVAPVFTATKPDTLPNDKRYPALARAFFYEIAGVAFMLFASLARRNRKEDQQAAANPLLDAIRQLHAAEASASAAVTACNNATQTIATQTVASLEELAEATTAASTAAEHCTQATRTIATQTATSMEQLAEATTAASTAATACNNATQTITTQTVASLEELAEATTAASTAATACNNATQTITTQTVASLEELAEATKTANAAINPAESLRLQLVAATDQAERAATAVKIEIAKAAELQTSPLQVQTSPANVTFTGANVTCKGGENPEIKRPTLEQTILLLKNAEIRANKFGQVSVSTIQKITGLGRDLATEAQEEALRLGYLIKQPNGYCYYPATSTAPTANVVQIPLNRRA